MSAYNLKDEPRHIGLRRRLVAVLQEKGIKDARVLEAISLIPRHFFFETALIDHAYQDKAFPIAAGQTISQPYTVAKQTELLEIKPMDKVLEIGTGSGYQCAVLCALGARVYSIEYIETLYQSAKQMLAYMGYSPSLFHGDGTKGLPIYGPFHKILITAGAPAVPDTLLKQLHLGGIMVAPVGDLKQQRMMRYIKTMDGRIITEDHGAFVFVPLVGQQGWSTK